MHKKQKIEQTLPSAELEYSIQYDWGQLHMTKAANDAYDIVPLTSVIEGGSDEYRHIDEYPSIDITITSPNEFVEPVRPVTTKKQPSLVGTINLGINTDSLIDNGQEKLIEFIETTGIDIPEDDIRELRDTIERDTPQMMAHILVELASKEAQLLISENEILKSERRLLKRIKTLGFTAIGGSVAVVTPSIILNDGIVSPINAVIGLGYTGAYIKLIHRSVKDYLKFQPLVDSGANALGYFRSLRVADDIHQSFCRKHFDENFEVS